MNRPAWVLDTNVVVDWLVFDDPYMAPLRNAVSDDSLTVWSHPLIAEELRRILGYRQLKLAPDRQATIHARYLASTTPAALPEGAGRGNHWMLPGGFPRCRDRDDEVFIALAFHQRADALVSRDNAVLGLRSRAERFGLSILNVQQAIAFLSNRNVQATGGV